MSSQRSILLGLFFLITVGVLGYYTLFLTDFTLFHARPEMHVFFSQANGAREGDSVLVAGVRWGRIKKITFDPRAPLDHRIVVTVSLNEPLELRRGFTIEIRDATPLGGRHVWIDPGPADGEIMPTTGELRGEVARGPLDALGDLVSSSQKSVTTLLDDAQQMIRSMRDGKGTIGRLIVNEDMANDLADAIKGASQTIANMQVLTADLRAGRGTVGKLLTDDVLFTELTQATKKLTTALDEATTLAHDARTGNGLLGVLISDESIAHDVQAAAANLRSVIAKVDSGRGIAGALINDEQVAADWRKITDAVANGEGTVGALIVKRDVYENLERITEDTATVMSTIRSGQGSFGRLVMDDEVYQQIRTMLQVVTRSLEEYREAAPITTFTSVFFSAF